MSDESKLILTREDFIGSNWEKVLEKVDKKDRFSYSSTFYSKIDEISDEKQKQIFLLLATLMTSWLNLETLDSPFENIDRFNEQHLKFFSEIIEDVTDDEIKSRMADVLWLRTKNHMMAETAVESYLNSAKTLESFEDWLDTQNRFERALQLASMLGKKRNLYQKVLDRICDLLDRCNGEDPLFLSAELMRLLQERGEGDAKKYAQFCEKLALSAETQKDFHKARKYWETKAEWHRIDKDKTSAREAKLKIAESYEKESDFNLENRQPKFMMASHPIEEAIVAYKKAGDSSKKIEELQLRLREYQSKGVEELPLISSDSVDITDIFIHSQKTISGRSFIDSLKTLSLLSAPNDVNHIRKQVEENRSKYIFSSLMPKKLFSTNGRIVAIQPSTGEMAVLADMFEYVNITYQLRVKGFIEPARSVILLEHSARVFEFYDLLRNHPFIPEGREFIVARGLHAGLNGDFLASVHFLIPQIEESVRYFLIRCGIVPSSFTDKGIQDEYNLNKLLTNEKFTVKLNEIFGENFVFDLRCVLIERFGANLRNDMAHGLIEHNSFYSYAAVYFWWLALRFYILPVLLNNDSETNTLTPEE